MSNTLSVCASHGKRLACMLKAPELLCHVLKKKCFVSHGQKSIAHGFHPRSALRKTFEEVSSLLELHRSTTSALRMGRPARECSSRSKKCDRITTGAIVEVLFSPDTSCQISVVQKLPRDCTAHHEPDLHVWRMAGG